MDEYDLWFYLSPVSINYKLQMLKRYGNSKEIWNYTESLNQNDKNLSQLNKFKNIIKFEIINRGLINNEYKIATYFDKEYPPALKNFDDSPFAFFYKGNIEKLLYGHNVSIVGSRNCTNYGMNVAKNIAGNLGSNNINVVSGFARGIDSISHKYCLQNGGYTCAVFGCGIDIVYPKENRELYESIEENGAIISEFLPSTEPYAYNFPRRNRIISALSELTIVIEAGNKSGSLITARLALEMGKDVMAVPGSVFSPESLGSNNLIKDGAFVFTDMKDVYDLLKINIPVKKHSKREVNNSLTTEEKKILKQITDVPIHIDELVRNNNIDIRHLYELLFEMQLNNEIISLPGKFYAKCNNRVV